jgi:hypothetical protein
MREQETIFGEMRANGGLTGIPVHCADCQCSYSNGDVAG